MQGRTLMRLATPLISVSYSWTKTSKINTEVKKYRVAQARVGAIGKLVLYPTVFGPWCAVLCGQNHEKSAKGNRRGKNG
jgi:hypothetical protein